VNQSFLIPRPISTFAPKEAPGRLILLSNDEEYQVGYWRKEAILTNNGLVIATSQEKVIDLMFGRPVYDVNVMTITTQEMNALCEWWARQRAAH